MSLHHLNGVFAAERYAIEIGREHLAPAVEIQALWIVRTFGVERAADSGVVDQNVEAPEFPLERLEARPPGILRSHIQPVIGCVVPELPCESDSGLVAN